VVIISPGCALAADAGVPVKAPIQQQVYNWSGLYAGVHAGYAWGMKDWFNFGEGGHFRGDGFIGGGQIGINQQIGGGWVLGIEADASWSGFKGSQRVDTGGVAIPTIRSSVTESKINWLASVAFRTGLAVDRWLVYSKFGVAVAQERHAFDFTQGDLAQTFSVFDVNASETRVGPLFGFGVEYVLWGNWSTKIEYNFISFGEKAIRLRGTQTSLGVTTAFEDDARIGQPIHLVKAGLNYRFLSTPPAPGPAAAPAVGYDWSGLYIGGQAGYGWGSKNWPAFNPQGGQYNLSGWSAGGQIGVNAQSGRFVAGVEAEAVWTKIDGSATFPFVTTNTVTLSSQMKWLAMVTGRIGYTPFDRWLIYGKAGVAIADEHHDHFRFAPVPPQTLVLAGSRLHSGWVIGGGAEWAMIGSWSVKAEYNFIDFGTQFVTLPGVFTQGATTAASALNLDIHQTMHLVKFGLNYHFHPQPAPIAARY
jgi:opacity protein-like surface antigen